MKLIIMQMQLRYDWRTTQQYLWYCI